MYQLITSNDELQALCYDLQSSQWLALDTEFFRERTFYPQAGLLQLEQKGQIYLVDPLQCEIQPILTLLENPFITKVMHSASEDVELFYALGASSIKGLFDTQIAASWLGGGLSLSLQKLVQQHHDFILDKSQTRTNWLKRPLSEAQLRYAAEDVRYLVEIAQGQLELLQELGFYDYFKEDCESMAAFRDEDPELSYLNISSGFRLQGSELSRMKRLATWRERVARRDDKPRPHILKDNEIVQVASQVKSVDDLEQLELHPAFLRRYRDELLAQLFELKDEDCKPVIRLQDISGAKSMLASLRQAIANLADKNGIPAEVMPSKRILESVIKAYVVPWYPMPERWTGWREVMLAPLVDELLVKYPLKLEVEI